MSSADLLTLTPTELRFRFELRKNVPCTMTLHNPTGGKVAFKVREKRGEEMARGARADRFALQPSTFIHLSRAPSRALSPS